MPKKNLLLCLDAFGTIFSPKRPIAEQYAEVARSFGIESDAKDVGAAFKKAFKEESKAHPNYGKAVGMGAEKWWTNVITKTFTPLSSNPLPPSLAPTLLNHFSSSAAYTLHPDIKHYLHNLRTSPSRQPNTTAGRLIVGIITNSDDRVPSILTSLGLTVGPLSHGSDIPTSEPDTTQATQQQDIDFCIQSYDVGFEKPSPEIFSAATDMLKAMLRAESNNQTNNQTNINSNEVVDPLSDWDRVYIGDEMEKDGKGALDAGWDAVVVDRRDGQTGVSYMVKVGDRGVDVVSDFGVLGNLRGRWGLICG